VTTWGRLVICGRLAIGLIAFAAAYTQTAPDYRKPPTADWPLVGGDWGNTRYSPLAKINTSNVKTLTRRSRNQTGKSVTMPGWASSC
jgi:glucose dehydrogenase